jgi:hypothetical protein
MSLLWKYLDYDRIVSWISLPCISMNQLFYRDSNILELSKTNNFGNNLLIPQLNDHFHFKFVRSSKFLLRLENN